MNGRLAFLAALTVMLGATVDSRPAAAKEAGKWCMTYCDAVHVGCKKTIGLLDPEACEEWHKGCLDGCRVNEEK